MSTSNTPWECLICGAPLIYLEHQETMKCAVCGGSFSSHARCANGHYICDSCHAKDALDLICQFCLHTELKNPVAIMEQLIDFPQIHMHGPEHHVLVGAALLAAYKNCGGELDLSSALDQMKERGSQVPGGICGQWGTCGAGVSTGIFMSIATGATPLTGASWGLANQMTARSLSSIGQIGGPRCCKRDSYTAILSAIDFADEQLHIKMEWPNSIRCRMSERNAQCIKKACPYHSAV